MIRLKLWYHILFKCYKHAYEDSYTDLEPLKDGVFPEKVYYCGLCGYGDKRGNE